MRDAIEVSRRIEREPGSTYRVNGREVRARDVQLLFADASTGARSPAMVRQGQIGEIISAKPQERRRILEEAAGVAGLHSRRHEAELRLKAAEDNLTRLDDILQQIDSQAESLEAAGAPGGPLPGARGGDPAATRRWLRLIPSARGDSSCSGAERSSKPICASVSERTRTQAEAARLQAIAAHELPALRDDRGRGRRELQRLVLARETLDGEERRAKKPHRRA